MTTELAEMASILDGAHPGAASPATVAMLNEHRAELWAHYTEAAEFVEEFSHWLDGDSETE